MHRCKLFVGIFNGRLRNASDKTSNDYTTIALDSADTQRAQHLNSRGVAEFRQGHWDKAERHYRDALIADVNFGPAHNNLGQLYLSQGQLYLAAWEFELATNTMPDRIEPQLNLGLVYEQAQRWDRAEEFFRVAYDQNPHSADAIAYLVRVLVRTDSDKAEINQLLHESLLYDPRPDRKQWCRELLATRYRDEDCCVVDNLTLDNPDNESTDTNPGTPKPAPTKPELLPSPKPESEAEAENSAILLVPPFAPTTPFELRRAEGLSPVGQASALSPVFSGAMIDDEYPPPVINSK